MIVRFKDILYYLKQTNPEKYKGACKLFDFLGEDLSKKVIYNFGGRTIKIPSRHKFAKIFRNLEIYAAVKSMPSDTMERHRLIKDIAFKKKRSKRQVYRIYNETRLLFDKRPRKPKVK